MKKFLILFITFLVIIAVNARGSTQATKIVTGNMPELFMSTTNPAVTLQATNLTLLSGSTVILKTPISAFSSFTANNVVCTCVEKGSIVILKTPISATSSFTALTSTLPTTAAARENGGSLVIKAPICASSFAFTSTMRTCVIKGSIVILKTPISATSFTTTSAKNAGTSGALSPAFVNFLLS